MFDWFNPLDWGISVDEYRNWWYVMLNTFFKGLWAKVIATASLLFSVYSVVRRKFRPSFAIFAYLVAIFFAYFGSVLNYLSGV